MHLHESGMRTVLSRIFTEPDGGAGLEPMEVGTCDAGGVEIELTAPGVLNEAVGLGPEQAIDHTGCLGAGVPLGVGVLPHSSASIPPAEDGTTAGTARPSISGGEGRRRFLTRAGGGRLCRLFERVVALRVAWG